ncbi:hypothetical protein ALO98_05348 [Pseudomonas syringae pv. tagetis]|nr:hypothetical protein ALO98_05348 [Pseudomonas syringae pv. tagetis]
MNTQYAIGLGIGNDLDEAAGVVGCHGTAAGRERERTDIDFNAFGLERLLGLADPGDFRVGVDNRRDQVVVHLSLVALDALDHHDAFFRGLVRQHQTTNHVTDGIDTRYAGGAVVINVDETALVQVDATVRSQQVSSNRTTTHGHDQAIEGDRLFASSVGIADNHFFAFDLGTGHTSAQLDVQALLGEGFQRFLGNRFVGGRDELVQCFQNSDLGTQASPYGAQLQTDHASADDAETLWNLLEFQCASRIDDDFLVNRSRRNVNWTRARRQDHMVRFDDFDSAISSCQLDLLASQQFAMALQGGHAIGFEQAGNAASQAFDDRRLAADHGRNVHAHFRCRDAMHAEAVFGFVEFPGAVKQCLGRNATNVQAGTAKGQFALLVLILLDAGSLETKLRSLDGGNITARACANHYHVEFLGHKKKFLFSC